MSRYRLAPCVTISLKWGCGISSNLCRSYWLGQKKLQELILGVEHRLLPMPNRPLPKDRLQQRTTIVALHVADIDNRSIAIFTEMHPKTVSRWICRVEEGKPITDIQRSGRPRRFSTSDRLMTIAVYCQQCPPLPGVHRWSLRDAQKYFKEHPESLGAPISHATIHRILLEHALRPHRRKYYLQITEPDFLPEMEHVIGLYCNTPQHLYCFDECTCIQALKRLTPTLPPSADQPARENFDYHRNGATDLLAFLNPSTGEIYGQCTKNHIGDVVSGYNRLAFLLISPSFILQNTATRLLG